LGIPPNRVRVVNIRPGSVQIDFVVLPGGDSTKTVDNDKELASI